MTTAQIIAGIVGLMALTLPKPSTATSWVTGLWQGLRKPQPPLPTPLPTPREEAVTPSYAKAIGDLAGVRLRLKATNCLKDEQLKSIDTLTLALVAGSDQ